MPHHQFSIITQKFPGGPFKFQEISRISRSCRHPVVIGDLTLDLSIAGLHKQLVVQSAKQVADYWAQKQKNDGHERRLAETDHKP